MTKVFLYPTSEGVRLLYSILFYFWWFTFFFYAHHFVSGKCHVVLHSTTQKVRDSVWKRQRIKQLQERGGEGTTRDTLGTDVYAREALPFNFSSSRQ